MTPIIEAKNIKYRYNNKSKWVLNGFDLSVKSGEIVGIIGPNGSGKTTALKLLCKVLKPSHGKIMIAGEDISQMKQRDIAKMVAVVPQGEITAFPFTELSLEYTTETFSSISLLLPALSLRTTEKTLAPSSLRIISLITNFPSSPTSVS